MLKELDLHICVGRPLEQNDVLHSNECTLPLCSSPVTPTSGSAFVVELVTNTIYNILFSLRSIIISIVYLFNDKFLSIYSYVKGLLMALKENVYGLRTKPPHHIMPSSPGQV